MTNELEEMKKCFLNHLSSAFQQSTFAHQDTAKNHSNGVFRVHRERSVIVTMIFENDSKLLEMLNKQCVQFFTQNSTQKPSELLAGYCNFLLKKSKHKISEQELDAALNQVLCLYEFLEDKDLFEKLYRKMLAHRLVNGMSSGKEAEFIMVEKMRLKLEFRYVSKLHRMLKLQQCVEIFEQFHNTTYHKRKLHWLHNSHSRGEILSNCFKKPYCFKATTLQMTVLLLFNSMDSYSIGGLAELTKLGINSLLQVLESLIKAKIFITGNGEKAADLNNDSVICLLKEYDNGRLHVNIASPIK
ncbi:unnamed protein product [Orchesella dallaii]|uniref:Cullin family profile domain-containing protein n=1 Tax=Orchesella dallaii TaxID=48710 RepID=A0ABP1S299_9HEXA